MKNLLKNSWTTNKSIFTISLLLISMLLVVSCEKKKDPEPLKYYCGSGLNSTASSTNLLGTNCEYDQQMNTQDVSFIVQGGNILNATMSVRYTQFATVSSTRPCVLNLGNEIHTYSQSSFKKDGNNITITFVQESGPTRGFKATLRGTLNSSGRFDGSVLWENTGSGNLSSTSFSISVSNTKCDSSGSGSSSGSSGSSSGSSGSGSSSSGSGSSSSGSGSGSSTTGRVSFWTRTSDNLDVVSVTISGDTRNITLNSSSTPSSCGLTGDANYTLTPGSYSYTARESGTSRTWSGSVTITANGCLLQQLTK